MEKKLNSQDYLSILGGIILLVGIVIGIYFVTRTPDIDDSYFKGEFLGGCMEDANYEFCSCAYDSLKKELGIEGLLAMSVKYEDTGVMPDEAYKAVAKCVEEL